GQPGWASPHHAPRPETKPRTRHVQGPHPARGVSPPPRAGPKRQRQGAGGGAPEMGQPVQTASARVLSLQMFSHALIFVAQNASNLAERALLAPDAAATAALGRGWAAFALFEAFTSNMVGVCPLVVGRCAGDDGRARAAAGQALLLACGGG